MGKETEQLGKDIAKGLVSELAQTDGMKRRAAALLAAQSMDYNFKDPAVARVATNKSSMGVALANLYNTGGHKIPELADLGENMAPNVGRVIDKKSRMGRRLTELYTKRNEDDAEKKEKSEAVEEADRIEEKKAQKESVKHLKSLDDRQAGLLDVTKKGFAVSSALLSGLGAKLLLMSRSKGSSTKLWAGGLAGLAGVFGAGDKDGIVGQLVDLLPDNIKEGFTSIQGMISSVVGEDTMKKYGPLISKIFAGFAGAALLGLTPPKLVGMAANASGLADAASGNGMSALIKATITGVLATLGYRALTSDKDPMDQIQDDLGKAVGILGSIKDAAFNIWRAVEPIVKWIGADTQNATLAAVIVGSLMTGLPQALIKGFAGGLATTLIEGLVMGGGAAAIGTTLAPIVAAAIATGVVALAAKMLWDTWHENHEENRAKRLKLEEQNKGSGKTGEQNEQLRKDIEDGKSGLLTPYGQEIYKQKLEKYNEMQREQREKQAKKYGFVDTVLDDPTPKAVPDRTLADLSKLEDKNSRHNPIIIQGDTNVNNVNKSGGGSSGPSGTQVNPGAGSAFDPYENFLQMSVYGFGS